ncbi:MAG TPA: hypothetical protein VK361_04620 [Rubrobacteraceae bacterium]|nr:hypothetical protein [Rubrobacteraceae bacterium]
MFETLERLILLQIGAAAATRDRVQEAVNRLIEQGRLEREEGRTMVEDILSQARERSAGARALVDTSMQRGLRATGFPNRDAYEDLLFRVEQLEHRVRLLEGRPDAQTRPETPLEPAAPTAGEPTPPTTPPVGGVDLAPQPPRDEPETPPGWRPGRR